MTTRSEILDLEERLRQAELGPDPTFFEQHMADDVVFPPREGHPPMTKAFIVQAHQPGAGPIFTRVEMTDLKVIEHGDAAVVTCKGTYEGPKGSVSFTFMRVWLKRNGRWQIIAVAMAN
jgi:ketosteroid isomerase-like protein